MKLNKKGFTLVELLAVIVILAVVMLIAVTAVGPAIERANKGGLASTARSILTAAEQAYTLDQLSAASSRKFKVGTKTCVLIDALDDAQYFDSKGKTYYGSVLVDVDSNNHVTYRIWIANENYYIIGIDLARISLDEVHPIVADDVSGVHLKGFKVEYSTSGGAKTGVSKAYWASSCGDESVYPKTALVWKLN